MRFILTIAAVLSCAAQLSAQPFTFVFLNKIERKEDLPKDQLDKLMEGHMANIQRLAKEGKLIAAGPFDGGGGIFVFQSGSKTEVENWLATDPGVQAKRWRIEMFPYQPRTGSVCKVGENYTMTNYQFIRFSLNLTKYTAGEASSMLNEHERYIREHAGNNFIAEGTFGSSEGGILIMREGADTGWIAADPAIAGGTVEWELKKLFIAKGAFCEK